MLVQCHLYAVAASALPRFLNSHCSRGLVAIFAIIMTIIVTLIIITTIILVSLLWRTLILILKVWKHIKKHVDFDFEFCVFGIH